MEHDPDPPRPARFSPRVRVAIGAGYALAVVGVGLLRLPAFRYAASNDGIQYVRIAEKYAALDLVDATNGSWSPLISWLMAPLIVAGVEPLLSGHLVQIGIGALAAVAIYVLSLRFPMSDWVRGAVTVSLLAAPMTFIGTRDTPDMLLAGILLLYFAVVFSRKFPDRPWNGLLAGALGALAYFAKSYAFFFFFAHFAAVAIWHWVQSSDAARRKQLAINVAVGAVTFAVLATPWIINLSDKYGAFTVSTATGYNRSLVGPEAGADVYERKLQHPMADMGLRAPPNETAVSIWEDFTEIRVDEWHPLGSWRELKHQLGLVASNVWVVLYRGLDLNIFFVTIVAAALWLGVLARGRRSRHGVLVASLISLAIYCSGYMTMHISRRYMWPVVILAGLMGGGLLQVLFDRAAPRRWVRGVVLAAYATALVLPLAPSFLHTFRMAPSLEQLHETAVTLEQEIGVHGRVASSGDYYPSQHLVFLVGAQYHGVPLARAGEPLAQELLESRIDYYLDWGSGPVDPWLAVAGYHQVATGETPGLRVFQHGP